MNSSHGAVKMGADLLCRTKRFNLRLKRKVHS
jgi:hypothetical protein